MLQGTMLGMAETTQDLVPGEPETLTSTADQLRGLGDRFRQVGQGMRDLGDTSHWSGDAAEEFRAYFHGTPEAWFTAADAFDLASTAIGDYSGALAEAQRKVADILESYKAGERASQAAEDARNQAVYQYNAQAAAANAGQGQPPPPLGPFHDPGKAAMEQAVRDLLILKAELQPVADEATATVTRATAMAPPEPSAGEQVLDNIGDTFATGAEHFGEAVSGFGSAIEGGFKQLRIALSPFDPWALTHPEKALRNMADFGGGLLNAVTHPLDTLGEIVDAKDWANGHWGRALGHIGANFIPVGAAGKGFSLGHIGEDIAAAGGRELTHHLDAPTGHVDTGGAPPRGGGHPGDTGDFGPHGGDPGHHDPGDGAPSHPADTGGHDTAPSEHRGDTGQHHDTDGNPGHDISGHSQSRAPESIPPAERANLQHQAIEHEKELYPHVPKDIIAKSNKWTRLTDDGHYDHGGTTPGYARWNNPPRINLHPPL